MMFCSLFLMLVILTVSVLVFIPHLVSKRPLANSTRSHADNSNDCLATIVFGLHLK